jgi:hypothetical protein
MEHVLYYFKDEGQYVDAATLRHLTGLCKSRLHSKLNALESIYPTRIYGNRKLYPAAILEEFNLNTITRHSQKDNVPTPTAKNEVHD